MHHHGGRKKRRQQVEEWNRQKGRNDQPGHEDGGAVFYPEQPGVSGRAETHRREFEEFPAEQVTVHQKKRDEVDTGNKQQKKRNEVAGNDNAEKLDG